MRDAKLLALWILLISFTPLHTQNQFSKWYFGNAGLDFMTSTPSILVNSIMGTSEGCASIADASGNLLFYSDGNTIATSNHTIMANGTGLVGDQSSTQAVIIVKQPGNTNVYYVFTTQGGGLHAYNIVDMNLAAGYGSVTVKNASLYTQSTEKQVAVRHCNGKDIWIIGHEGNNRNFRSYLLTSVGLNTVPVISSIGEVMNGYKALGHLKISPDGHKLANASSNYLISPSTDQAGITLYDFDAATGVISNSLIVKGNISAYGVEFSPDGTKLYGATQNYTSSSSGLNIYQWSICNSNTTAIAASEYSIASSTPLGSIQRAIDGKLYIAVPVIASQSIHVINNPNLSGSGMGLVFNGQSIAPKLSANGLPNYINSYVKPQPTPFTNTLSCQTASFTVPAIPTFSSGCSSTPYAPSAYSWDFGESSSGTTNTSTLTSPSHFYANTGTYTVSLILFNNCTNDTLKQVVNITTAGPNPQVAGTFTVCKGDKQTYTVSGGSSYLWFNNATTNTLSISPSTSTVYSVRTTSNGCNVSKSFSVTVNPCLGLSPVVLDSARTDIRIYPNPATNKLFIETSAACDIQIYNISGQLVLQTNLQQGKNELNLALLNAGMYSIKANLGATAWYSKLIKVE